MQALIIAANTGRGNMIAMSLCRLLERAALDIEWRCILYPHRVNEELVATMSRAGCAEVSLGFESGSLRCSAR